MSSLMPVVIASLQSIRPLILEPLSRTFYTRQVPLLAKQVRLAIAESYHLHYLFV